MSAATIGMDLDKPRQVTGMYKHILIATDGSELGQKAVGQGMALARALDAKVLVVTVTEPWSSMVSGEMTIAFPADEYAAGAAAAASRILAGSLDIARKAGVSIDTLHVKDRFPAEGIVETAAARGCDLIVMASHGRRGLSRMLLGSQANRVVTHSTIPVLICR
ncbi:MAG: universal stress protein [Hyphomicrobiaceae bacterium]